MTLQDEMYNAMQKLADSSTGWPYAVTLTPITMVEVTLSLDTSAYSSGDVLADTQEVASAVRSDGGYGRVVGVTVLDKDDQAQGLDLVFMRTNKSLGTENSALTMSDADAEELLGTVEVASGDYVDLTNNQIAMLGDLWVPVKADTSSTSIFMGAISRGTGTYTASGIVVKVFIEQY